MARRFASKRAIVDFVPHTLRGSGRRCATIIPCADDLDAGTLDIDFVLHREGPASSWATQARLGQNLLIAGPRGSLVVPVAFDWYLLAGNEIAIPALARQINELLAQARVIAIIEVDDLAEHQPFRGQVDVTLVYVYRNSQPPSTISLILDRIRATALPEGVAHAFVAGEASMSKAIRAYLTEERGFDPEYIRPPGIGCSGSRTRRTSAGTAPLVAIGSGMTKDGSISSHRPPSRRHQTGKAKSREYCCDRPHCPDRAAAHLHSRA
ncbi:MAG: SIP domain-containing protein [Candidatus Devosia symbiotica]|nr:SIP domain-containing protein [Candidatus Devosia symbiotica]